MNNLMTPQPNAPQPQGQPSATPAVSPQAVAQARAEMKAMTNSLMGLAAKPKGSLSKEDLYGAAADMIANGAFSTPEAKQGLVAELAQIPDDEGSVRQAIGQHLMFLAHAGERLHATYGPEE